MFFLIEIEQSFPSINKETKLNIKHIKKVNQKNNIESNLKKLYNCVIKKNIQKRLTKKSCKLKNKMSQPICKLHNKPQKYICLCQSINCSLNRLCCTYCLQQIHKGHNYKQFRHLDEILCKMAINDSQKSKGSAEVILENLNKLSINISTFNQYCNKLLQMTQNSRFDFPRKIITIAEILTKICKSTISNHCYTLAKEEKYQEFQSIVEVLRFIYNQDITISTQQEFTEVLDCVWAKINQSLTRWYEKVTNAFSQLQGRIHQHSVSNWINLYKAKYPQKFTKTHNNDNNIERKRKLKTKPLIDRNNKDNNNNNNGNGNSYQFKHSELGKMQIDPQLKQQISSMFASIFNKSKQTDNMDAELSYQLDDINKRNNAHINNIKITKNDDEKSYRFPFFNIDSNNQIMEEKNIKQQQNYLNIPLNQQYLNLNMMNKTNKINTKGQKMQQQQNNPINASPNTIAQRHHRLVINQQNILKIIKKQQFLDTINKLSQDINYITYLRQFIIEGPNQFDLQCLALLVEKFPNLTKFNYIWNFQEQGLRLQKEQIFFQKTHCMQKNKQDLKTCPELFSLYSNLKQLENIQINDIQTFTFSELKVANKNIKHLTLGQYLQNWQEKYLPDCLKKQTLTFNGLITLNIFNVQIIDGGFMESVVNKNVNTLKNIWLSQCVEFEDSFMTALQNSRLQSIIFEQIKCIKATISIPETTQTLILQNCEVSNKKPFNNLKRAKHLINFSIFDSAFYDKSIGDKIVQELSSIQVCNVKYLNVGECRSVTDRSIKYLQKMQKLKDLCIDNTQITLRNFVTSKICFYRLKKLGIVGLKLNQQSEAKIDIDNPITLQKALQTILIKSSKLQTFSLKFTDQVANINKQTFKNLKHISLTVSSTGRRKKQKKQYKKQNLKQFVQALKLMKKSINIV